LYLIVASLLGWLQREQHEIIQHSGGRVRRRQRVGGLLSYYYRAA
jgi:hypothetical protein